MGADEKQADDRGWLVEQRYRAVLEVLDGSPSARRRSGVTSRDRPDLCELTCGSYGRSASVPGLWGCTSISAVARSRSTRLSRR
jgi:hypothetical protein